ncbi:hypothetical protein [Hoylesella timonensis]|uniref:hypothetical protein n=1 Tax=Hoylesella timonensis TaxID=386414 RepID=UPI00288B79E8|nr:hypothetical protein [Hoylesella timonensis]
MSSQVHEFPSFSKACEQRCYLHTIDRLLHYFSAFISMFQQRHLSNHATSPTDLRNLSCRIVQRQLSNHATSTVVSCNLSCRIVQPQLPNYATPPADLRFE